MRPVEASNESDNRLPTLYCPKCGKPVYRHGPGEYGTEKPK